MNTEQLIATTRSLMADHKGLLAMDESNGTCNKRFAAEGIPQTVEARRAYRELIITTPGLNECVSGMILYDETTRQSTEKGVGFLEAIRASGVIPGVKVDVGAKDLAGFPGEKVTEGLDGLREKLNAYAGLGLRFAKWRAVITLGEGLPSQGCVAANAHALARYAALCQEAGMVPIVEPEVLMDGDHDGLACEAATAKILAVTFAELSRQGILLEGMILKPNMVLPGLSYFPQPGAAEVGLATIACLARHVPAAVGGVAFLSGGQSGKLASERLLAINLLAKAPTSRAPWPLTFSFARAIQQPALSIWKGEPGNVAAAQHALLHRAILNRASRRGDYTRAMEMDV
jgi:fructose-bisphosphate aldolase class I